MKIDTSALRIPVSITSDSFDQRFRRKRLDKLLFERVEKAWKADWPLSAEPSTVERYLPQALTKKSEFKAEEIREAMQTHLENGNLKVDSRTSRTARGLKVVSNPFASERSE